MQQRYDGEEPVNNPLNESRHQLVKSAAVEIRLGFVRKVYSILAAQLLLTTAVALPFQWVSHLWLQQHMWIYIVSIVSVFASMCLMMCCGEQLRKYPQNYGFLFLFTSCMGVMVGFVSATYSWQSVVIAAGITMFIFLGLTIYAWNTTTDFTGMGPYIFAALMCLSCFGLLVMILSFCGIYIRWMIMVYDIIGVLVFSFYIIFDTQMILGQYGGHKNEFSIDDYCFAALSLYLDIINLFLFLLQLIGNRD